MLSQPTVIRPATQDLMTELHIFIGGATKNNHVNPLDLAKTALNLIKNLPAARDAVLEYFCTVFDKAAMNYVVRIEVSNNKQYLGTLHTQHKNFIVARVRSANI